MKSVMSKLLLIEDESKHNNLAAFGVKFCTINSLSVNICTICSSLLNKEKF